MKSVGKLGLVFLLYLFTFNIQAQNSIWNIENFKTSVGNNQSTTLNKFETIELAFQLKGWNQINLNYTDDYSSDIYYKPFYDTTKIDCYGLLVSPSNKNIKIFGFFDKEPNISSISCNDNLFGDINAVDGQEEYYSSANGPEFWKFRFTPSEAGHYQFTLFVKHSGTIKSIQGGFTVNESNLPGFINIPESDSKHFHQQNVDGIHFPIGINDAWSFGYKDGPPNSSVAGFCYWKNSIDNLAKNGGNVLRIWLNLENAAPGFQPSDLTLYDYNVWGNNPTVDGCYYWDFRFGYSMENAFRLDQLINYAKSKNVNIQFSVLIPNMNEEYWPNMTNTQPQKFSIWKDNNGAPIPPLNNINQCHSFPVKSTKHYGSGEINNPFEFYKNDVIASQRYLFRYIISRYGYATNIISWETGNELDYSILPDKTGNFNKAFKNFPNPDYKNTTKTKDLLPSELKQSQQVHLNRINAWSKSLTSLIKYYDFHDHIVISGQRVSEDKDNTPWININGTMHVSDYGMNSLINSDFNHAHVYIGCPALDTAKSNPTVYGKSDMSICLHDYLKDFESLAVSTKRPTWIQEFDWGYELGCASIEDAIYMDPHGFYVHSVYWSAMLSGHSALPLIFGWDQFKSNNKYNQIKSISNFINANMTEISSNNSSFRFSNDKARVFGIKDNSTNIVYGWMQNSSFEFHKLLTDFPEYLQNLSSNLKPSITDDISVFFEVSYLGDYQIDWYSTIDGEKLFSEHVRARFIGNKIKVKLSLPIDLMNNIYSDGVFIMRKICNSESEIEISYGNLRQFKINNSNINSYSSLNTPVEINYGEDLVLNSKIIINKHAIKIKFFEYEDDLSTGRIYISEYSNIYDLNFVSLNKAFKESKDNQGNLNVLNYFNTHNTKKVSYKIEIELSNIDILCYSYQTFSFYLTIKNCETKNILKIVDKQNSGNSPSNPFVFHYGEDILVDATSCTGETGYRISILEIDLNGNPVANVEPYKLFDTTIDSIISFNFVYSSMNNKYSNKFLPPEGTNSTGIYKLKVVIWNGYQNQGCELWNEECLYIKIESCSTVNEMIINGKNNDQFNLQNPLSLDYGDDFIIDCTGTKGETQFIFSVIEVDNQGAYLWSSEPSLKFSGNCAKTYSFNELYIKMSNKPQGRFLNPPSVASTAKYYKIKFVSMNAYLDDGCTIWNESNFFVKINSCHTTPILKINGQNGSTFNNPIKIKYGSKIEIDPTMSTGETQFRVSIIPVNQNGGYLFLDGWNVEPYFHVNSSSSMKFDLVKLIQKMINSPTPQGEKFKYFNNTHSTYKVKLITMNAYNDFGCDNWVEANEFIEFDFINKSVDFEINGENSNCIKILKECDPIIVTDIKTEGGNSCRIIFEKLVNCGTSNCSNCQSPSFLQLNAHEYPPYKELNGYTRAKLDPRSVTINGFSLYFSISDLNSELDIREILAVKYGSRHLIPGFYNVKIKVFNNVDVFDLNNLGKEVYMEVVEEPCFEPNRDDQDNNKLTNFDSFSESNKRHSVEEFTENHNRNIVFYPNPVGDFINLKAIHNLGKVTLRLYNETGQSLFSNEYLINDIQYQYDIKQYNLNPGFYILNVVNNEEEFNYKFIKE